MSDAFKTPQEQASHHFIITKMSVFDFQKFFFYDQEGEHISEFINGDHDEDLGNGFKEMLAAYGLDALLQMVCEFAI